MGLIMFGYDSVSRSCVYTVQKGEKSKMATKLSCAEVSFGVTHEK